MAKVALVTGAYRGIGFAVAKLLAKQGMKVLLTLRNENKGIEARDKLVGEKLDIDFLKLDVSDDKSIHEAMTIVSDKYHRLDILVNNAAIYRDEHTNIMDIDTGTMEEVMLTNVYGPMHLIQRAIPLMKTQNYGRIVNVSSGMGSLSVMDNGGGGLSYRVSKVALNMLTKTFAYEVRSYNIIINSVCPGWVLTEMGGPHATRLPEEGADSIIWLATLPDDGPRAGFFRERKVLGW